MGSSSPSRVLFFVLFFTVVTLGLRQFHSASTTRKISFRFLFGYHFRKEREKKIRENPEKETVVPADCCHWKNQRNPHKYRDLAEEQPKEKERMDGRKGQKRWPENSIGKENGFPHSRFILRKEKEEEKKKRDAGKGKEKGWNMRSGLAIVRRTYSRQSGAERG